ncbi:SMC-Scp complex subunit ScpB [Acidiplasma sp.]|uniref:SMC-Scp complex subunit ScpB n=1 Tax=Acidiplasma sp. TaxID=1872114 RepID=UPI002589381F|nr:SMC-Scp complex subunit ScpB [Acidiplasma sp.]
MDDTVRKIEAILYSSKEPLKVSDIGDYLNIDNNEVLKAIKAIETGYKEINSSLTVGRFGNKYKIKLSDEFSDIVSPFIEKEFNDKELAMLSYIFKHPNAISGDLREQFGYNYLEAVESLKKSGMISAKRYRNTHRYNVTKNFYTKFNINKRTLKKEVEK